MCVTEAAVITLCTLHSCSENDMSREWRHANAQSPTTKQCLHLHTCMQLQFWTESHMTAGALGMAGPSAWHGTRPCRALTIRFRNHLPPLAASTLLAHPAHDVANRLPNVIPVCLFRSRFRSVPSACAPTCPSAHRLAAQAHVWPAPSRGAHCILPLAASRCPILRSQATTNEGGATQPCDWLSRSSAVGAAPWRWLL